MDDGTVETSLLGVNPEAPEGDVIARAVAILNASGVVAIPTETVYGLAARALDAKAVGRIFEAKGRPAENPLIVHVLGAEDAQQVVAAWPEAAHRLAERFWPGPLTLVLPRRKGIPRLITAGRDTVAVRAPAHEVARAIIREVGVLAAPSANHSSEISPTTAAHVMASLGGRIPLVLDAGPTAVGIESTVLSLVHDRPTILRPGGVSRAALAEVLGEVDSVTADSSAKDAQMSPGTAARHYGPRAEVVLVDRDARGALKQAMVGAERPGALVHSVEAPPGAVCHRLPDDPGLYARGLYGALHALDECCDRILIERVPETDAWRAVADRLAHVSR